MYSASGSHGKSMPGSWFAHWGGLKRTAAQEGAGAYLVFGKHRGMQKQLPCFLKPKVLWHLELGFVQVLQHALQGVVLLHQLQGLVGTNSCVSCAAEFG